MEHIIQQITEDFIKKFIGDGVKLLWMGARIFFLNAPFPWQFPLTDFSSFPQRVEGHFRARDLP
jgi:hypothetical protein